MQRIKKKFNDFFSKQKSSETSKLEVDEQSENRPQRSGKVIYFVEQSESTPSASTSSVKVSLFMLPSLKLGLNYVY